MSELTRTSSVSQSTFSPSSILRYTGRVKWFNVKNGYGFITPVITHGDEEVDRDVFVHHTSISVGVDQYKYLTEGEYVDFNLERPEQPESSIESGQYFKYQAVDVTGVARGYLLCETKFASILAEQKRKARYNDKMELDKPDEEPLSPNERDSRNSRTPRTPRTTRTSSSREQEPKTPRPRRNDKRSKGRGSDIEQDQDEGDFEYPRQKKTFRTST